MGIAALIAWLVTAGSGAYVLGSWFARGGTLRRGARGAGAGTGSPPAFLLGHFGLALCGLVLWAAYLVTGWAALAWVAVGALLPVAGLGMATLVTGLPGRRAATAAGHSGDTGPAARDTAGIQVGGAGTSGATRTATIHADSAGTVGTGAVPVRARLAPMVVAAHGALAVTTMILVLLAALGGAAN
jgi:manganese efflux pump family protein